MMDNPKQLELESLSKLLNPFEPQSLHSYNGGNSGIPSPTRDVKRIREENHVIPEHIAWHIVMLSEC